VWQCHYETNFTAITGQIFCVMANKLNFTPQEWTKILESVVLVGMAVSAADPNGLWGSTKEALASRSALMASKHDAGSNELVKAVITDFESKEGRSAILEALHKRLSGADPADVVQRSLEDLQEVSAILDAKAPQDAAAFKILLVGISQKVAEASMEHTFLGFGGVQVSEAEKAALDDITKVLGTTVSLTN
jgi:D-tyrosyl-tRNA(Tyr) deacylase